MNLIDKIKAAISAKDSSQLAVLTAQAEVDLAPLKKSGQRVYVSQVEKLLEELAKVPKIAAPVKEFYPKKVDKFGENE